MPQERRFECHYGANRRDEIDYLCNSAFVFIHFLDLPAAFDQSSKAVACDQRDGISRVELPKKIYVVVQNPQDIDCWHVKPGLTHERHAKMPKTPLSFLFRFPCIIGP